MCLSIKVNHPELVLADSEHVGYQFIVVHNRLGYRCGYVRVPQGHPWHGMDYDEIDADVHGGLTFAELDVPCGKGDDNAYWVGFDCGHYMDAPDPAFGVENRYPSDGIVRTQEYVEAECRNLCEQAQKVA